MSWIIDQFSVKPSGFLASWRYRRVLVDEDGIVTSECIPNKPCLNLPCISDYNKSDRRYAVDQQITEYCNFSTFTNFRIYAQDCEPFAYTGTDLNAAKCGYLTPLPTPAVPPNPFGTALYGLFKFFQFCDIDGVQVIVNISRKSFVDSPVEIEAGGPNPVLLTYITSDDSKFRAMRGMECELTFISDTNFALKDFYTNDEREFKVEVIKAGITKFMGWMIPDSCQEPFLAPQYPISIRATDGLGALQQVSYPLPVGSSIDIRQSFLDILAYCFAMTNLNLNIATICNLYERKMANGLNDDPLAQATVNPLRLAAGGTVLTCYETLNNIAQLFGAYVAQIDGVWSFVRINELSYLNIRRRNYNNTGLFLFAENIDNGFLAGDNTQPVEILADGAIRIGNAYKRAVVDFQYGDVPAIVFNGDFELWDGQNFNYWTRYGSINVSRIQKEIPGNGGAPIPVQDFACAFNQKANSSQWLGANPITVVGGDKIQLNVDIGMVPGAVLMRIRVKLGQWYLYGGLGDNTTLTWVKSLAITDTLSYGGDSINYATSTLDMPPAPASGTMIIQIFGFVNAGGGLENYYPFPIPIDNVTLNRTAEETGVSGIFYVSEQLQFYTQEPEITEVLFGEYLPSNRPRPINQDQNFSLYNLYAIYTVDNSPSTGWKEYGSSGDYLPIGLALAYNILKQYQAPFRFYEGAFRHPNFNYLDVINIVVPDDFVFSSYTFMQGQIVYDLKWNTIKGTWPQIFSKNLNASNGQTPHSPGANPPPYIQNANNPSPILGDGIFTPQFDDTFA